MLIGSLDDSTVFSTICFNGSVIGLKGLSNKAINALPFELHIPGYQFCGPGTRLEKRLARGDRGINLLDTACREHDIAYSHNNGLTERHVADNILAEKARKRITARDSSLTERAAATAVWAAMKAKTMMGMGLKIKKRKSKRILLIAKRGGILPVLPLLGVLGSFAPAGVAKAVNDSRAAERQLEEMQRHNRFMEGHGVYLAPYKRGRGVVKRKKNVDETLKIPTGVTTNVQLLQLAKRMRIPYFRSIFMRTTLPVEGVHRNESGIVNLDNAEGPGTH
ncbi:hypothetical protein ALC62_01878 [Cyphomyrmex costatus]|uniref:Phospholipase A2-like domain-containing protein n=1 Tax=Cyphomyrmex costatus TaxID=456900 RepID=A0A151IP89_9HYME|nr:hypothetical protein ALC62_01878 [Cyphomyrmex costatus]